MTTDRSDRWRTAIHEAAHAVAGLRLGGRVDGLLLVADGGLAHCDELSPDNHAFMTAAGPNAERLADEYDAPDGPLASYKEIATNELPEGTSNDFAWSCSFADVQGVSQTAKSDARTLAEWAITSHEHEPESWARRVTFAKRVAAELVDRNADAIARIAERLFIQGRLTGDEIKSLMRNGK